MTRWTFYSWFRLKETEIQLLNTTQLARDVEEREKGPLMQYRDKTEQDLVKRRAGRKRDAVFARSRDVTPAVTDTVSDESRLWL